MEPSIIIYRIYILVAILLFGIFIFLASGGTTDNDPGFFSQKKKREVIRNGKIFFIIYVNFFNIVFSFIPLKNILPLIIQGLITIGSFFILLFDLFITSSRRKKFIYTLQETCFQYVPLLEIFDAMLDDSEYIDYTKDKSKKIFVVNYKGKKTFAFIEDYKQYLLIPKKDISIDEFAYLEKEINYQFSFDDFILDLNKEIRMLNNKEMLNYKSIFEFDNKTVVFDWFEKKKNSIGIWMNRHQIALISFFLIAFLIVIGFLYFLLLSCL